jgi:hypothetical protein
MTIDSSKNISEIQNKCHPEKVEISQGGIYCHRDNLSPLDYKIFETHLSQTDSVLIFDFNIDSKKDMIRNFHNGTSFQENYNGTSSQFGTRIFHVDHHYDIPDLKDESSTPLVKRWLLQLHENNQTQILKSISNAKYIANHADQDILFSIHLAKHAMDKDYLKEVGTWLSLAALRNDHVKDCEGLVEDTFHGGLFIEKEIKNNRSTFSNAQTVLIPALVEWLKNGQPCDISRGAEIEKSSIESDLELFKKWDNEGLFNLEDGILWFSPPQKMENAIFYLYLKNNFHEKIKIQLLCNLIGDKIQYKLRSHQDFSLSPLYDLLNEKFKGKSGGAFGGRHSAGGSKNLPKSSTNLVLKIIRKYLKKPE